MLHDAAEQTRELVTVGAVERINEDVAHHFDVAGKDALEHRRTLRRERHVHAALVLLRGHAGHEPRLLEPVDLVGQAALAVHQPVCEVGHAPRR